MFFPGGGGSFSGAEQHLQWTTFVLYSCKQYLSLQMEKIICSAGISTQCELIMGFVFLKQAFSKIDAHVNLYSCSVQSLIDQCNFYNGVSISQIPKLFPLFLVSPKLLYSRCCNGQAQNYINTEKQVTLSLDIRVCMVSNNY